MNPLLVTMRGKNDFNLESVSNFEAGLITLAELNRMVPGITWRQMFAGVDKQVMSGWLTDLGHIAGKTVRSVGEVVSTTLDYGGSKAGEAVRLVADDKVMNAATTAAAAYATGGGSAALQGLTGGDKGAADSIWQFIAALGSNAKEQAAGLNTAGTSLGGMPSGALPWVIAGGVVLVLMVGRGRR